MSALGPVLLVLSLTAFWLLVLHAIYRRATRHLSPEPAARPVPPHDGRRLAGPADLGVSAAGFARYVEQGLDTLAGYLAEEAATGPAPNLPRSRAADRSEQAELADRSEPLSEDPGDPFG